MSNPFREASTLPYALPDFGRIARDDLGPAIEEGMAEQLAEIARITGNPEPPTFDNTLVPLELSGQTLRRASSILDLLGNADTDEVVTALETALAPALAAHRDRIVLDGVLFERIVTVHAQRDTLEPEQRRLVERYVIDMTLAGAALDDAGKAELSRLNEQISVLQTAFAQAVTAETNDRALVLDSIEELDGLTPAEITNAAQAAASRGLDGRFLISLVNTTTHPYLTSLTRRDIRDRLARAQRQRCSQGGEHDTRGIVLELVRSRAARARLLGFENHASLVTADNSAHTPAAVRALMERLAPAAARNAATELAALSERAGFAVEAHDWAFYAEQVRASSYDVDLEALRPWFDAERVLCDGVFLAAHRLFGLTFTERDDLDGWHPDVRVFEVHDGDGAPLGLYLLDLYARESKRGGAWMDSLVTQSRLEQMPTAVVINVLNVPKPGPGEPTLLTIDSTETLFHEFGHALHGLLARATYPTLAGTAVYLDFVEYPSQVNEMWMMWPEILASYAVHHETGEPLPAEVVARLEAAGGFNQGYDTSEMVGATLIDLAWHELAPEEVPSDVEEVLAFEQRVLAAAGLDQPAVPPRYSTPYFRHSFGGMYAAGYYSYLWSEVLDADTVDWFKAHGGATRANGEAFRSHVIGIGGTRDAIESYVEWRGRPAPIEPLLARRRLL